MVEANVKPIVVVSGDATRGIARRIAAQLRARRHEVVVAALDRTGKIEQVERAAALVFLFAKADAARAPAPVDGIRCTLQRASAMRIPSLVLVEPGGKAGRPWWLELDAGVWDGTVARACAHTLSFLDAAHLEARHRLTLDGLVAALDAVSALRDVVQVAQLLAVEVRRRKRTVAAALQTLLSVIEARRWELLGIEGERYTVVVHRLRAGRLVPIARVAHPSVPSRGRTWPLGQSHVGIAAQRRLFMVSPDFRDTQAWVAGSPTDADDRRNYVSVMTMPLLLNTRRRQAEVVGTLTVSSDRRDHFSETDDLQAVAFTALASLATMLFVTGGRRG